MGDALWSSKEEQVICRDCNNEKHPIHDAVTGFEQVTRLQQYVYLLRVALARLLSVLRSGGTLPHTSGKVPEPLLLVKPLIISNR